MSRNRKRKGVRGRGPWVYREGYGLVTKEHARKIDAERAPPRQRADWLPTMPERGSWVLIGDKLIPKHEAHAYRASIAHEKRSELPAPAIRPDTIEVRSMVNGKMFDSRSAYYKHLKDTDHVIVDESEATKTHTPVTERPEYKKQLTADIVEAFQKHEQGWVAPPLKSARDFNIDVAEADESGFIRADGETAPVLEGTV